MEMREEIFAKPLHIVISSTTCSNFHFQKTFMSFSIFLKNRRISYMLFRN